MLKSFAIKEFISFKEIILFAIFVLIFLVLFFPKKQILSMILKNPLDVNPQLIKAVIRVDPSDNFKIALITNYVESGNYLSATEELKNLSVSIDSVNFFKYAGLKFKILSTDYYASNNLKEKEIIKNRIQRLLNMVSISNKVKFNEYIEGEGRDKVQWLFDAYKFESYTKNYSLALSLIKEYLAAYPEYKEKYYPNIMMLYLATDNDHIVYNMLYDYIQSKKNEIDKIKLFKTIVAKAILEKNYKLTWGLLKIYNENFSNNLNIEKFIIISAQKSGDPYFARNIVIKISRGKN